MVSFLEMHTLKEEIQSFLGKFKFQEEFLSRRFNADRKLRRGMSGREGSALSNDMRHSRENFHKTNSPINR